MKKFTMACAIVAGALTVNAQQLNWDVFIHDTGNNMARYSDFTIDKQGQMWVGAGNAGLLKFDSGSFEIKVPVNSTYSNAPHDLQIDLQGNVWFSTWGSGLQKYDGQVVTEFNEGNSDLLNDRMYGLHIDSKGNIWSAYNEHGIGVFDGTNWKYHYEYTADPNPLYVYGTAILEAKNGDIYVGTKHGEVGVFDGTDWNVTVPNTPPGFSRVSGFTEDNNNEIWVTTSGQGLAKITSSGWAYLNQGNSGLASDLVDCVLFDKNNNAWIGTSEGLNFFNGVTWLHFDENNSPLLNAGISSITVDSDENLWLTTGEGLIRITKEDQDVITASSVDEMNLAGFSMLPVYPNPFSDQVSFGVVIQKPAYIQFSLTDVSGKTLFQEDLGQKGSGTHRFTKSVVGLSPGFYFLELGVNDEKTIQRLIVE
ncbi:MAG: ligand-binding sensor domain-containing protein [Sphingobacteriales bacterium]|jgi:ligand-binding sensor domain-containing protein